MGVTLLPPPDLAAAAERAVRFAELHRAGTPLLMANAWDIGSAKILAHLGYQALATTSSGFANSLGRNDGGVTRDEAIAHGAALAAATLFPVSADLEHCFASSPEGAAETVALAAASGLAGCSIEDWDRDDRTLYDAGLARDRVAAAAEAAHAGPVRLVLTARAENLIRGVDDLDDTIARLQAYAAAGADVVFAPGVASAEQIGRLVEAVDVPVSVLVRAGMPRVAELAELGVARVSVGGAFALAAYGALAAAANELLSDGTYGYFDGVVAAVPLRSAFD
jgi:2-methylisocitrate lyase-like PEP mutase family enzyme